MIYLEDPWRQQSLSMITIAPYQEVKFQYGKQFQMNKLGCFKRKVDSSLTDAVAD